MSGTVQGPLSAARRQATRKRKGTTTHIQLPSPGTSILRISAGSISAPTLRLRATCCCPIGFRCAIPGRCYNTRLDRCVISGGGGNELPCLTQQMEGPGSPVESFLKTMHAERYAESFRRQEVNYPHAARVTASPHTRLSGERVGSSLANGRRFDPARGAADWTPPPNRNLLSLPLLHCTFAATPATTAPVLNLSISLYLADPCWRRGSDGRRCAHGRGALQP